MANVVGLLLTAVNFYCHLIGLSNFEYDWRTGQVFTSWKKTLYAATINAMAFIFLFLFLRDAMNFATVFGSANKLTVYVNITLTILRIIAGLLTALSRWSKRKRIMNFVKKFSLIFLANYKDTKVSSWWFFIKILSSFCVDLFHFALSINILGSVNPSFALGLCLQFWTLSITNLAILQYCLTVLSVRAKYKRLSTELRQIMKECEELSLVTQRNGVFMTRCCYLSDRLEEMALRQDQLQSIVVELNKTIGSQGVLVYSGYYISMVFCSYLTYSLIKNGREYFCLSLKHVILSYAWNFFYYFDALINFSLILSFLDDHKEVIRLLENRTLFASRLDSRLEESLEKFQLQLIRNPLKLTIMNLFPISRNCTAAMCGSIVTHTIVLIQYDLENF